MKKLNIKIKMPSSPNLKHFSHFLTKTHTYIYIYIYTIIFFNIFSIFLSTSKTKYNLNFIWELVQR